MTIGLASVMTLIAVGVTAAFIPAGLPFFSDGFESGDLRAWSQTVDGRSAALVDCDDVQNVQLTAEVNIKGYIPTGDGTFTVGGSALWVHSDGPPHVHDFTSGPGGADPHHDGLFQSPPFTDHGVRTCATFLAPGRYPYHCSFHPTIEDAVITVE